MPLEKFNRYMIELPDGSRMQRTFRTRISVLAYKKLKGIKKGKVIKVVFSSA